MTSMDKDGTRSGYDLEFLSRLTNMVHIPVIASGGAGTPNHFLEAFLKANVDACLAAGLFHYNILNIGELKKYLKGNDVNVRL